MTYGRTVAQHLFVQSVDDLDEVLDVFQKFRYLVVRVKFMHWFESLDKVVDCWLWLRLHDCLKRLIYQFSCLNGCCTFFLSLLFMLQLLGHCSTLSELPELVQFLLKWIYLNVEIILQSLLLDSHWLDQGFLLLDYRSHLLFNLLVLLALEA